MKKLVLDVKKFIKENIPLVLFVFAIAIAIYGLKLFSFNVGIDSDVNYANPYNMFYQWHAKEWRYGITILSYLLFGTHIYNMMFSNFLAIFSLASSCILLCYTMNRYVSNNNKAGLYLFSVFYVASIVWMEVMYFTYTAFPCMFATFVIPVGCIMMYEGIINKSLHSKVTGVILLVVSLTMYQPMGALFLAGILIIIFGEIENGKLEKKQFKTLLNVALLMVLSLIIYVILSLLVTKLVFKVELDKYVSGMLGYNGGIFKKLRNLVAFIYAVMFGSFRKLNEFLFVDIFKQPIEKISSFYQWSLRGSFLLFPSLIIYIVAIIKNKKCRSITYFLVAIGILVSAVAINILGNGISTCRYMHALPLVLGFIIYYSFMHINNKYINIVWMILCIVFASRFLFNSTMLQESDCRRYKFDVELSNKINDTIISKFSNQINDETKVFIIGRYPFNYGDSYMQGDIIGRSALFHGCEGSKIEATLRTIPFMKTLGYYYNGIEVNNERIDELRELAKTMPSYPVDGFAKMEYNVIIIKLNDFAYKQ